MIIHANDYTVPRNNPSHIVKESRVRYPQLVDFVKGLVNSVLNLSVTKVNVFGNSNYRRTVLIKIFSG